MESETIQEDVPVCQQQLIALKSFVSANLTECCKEFINLRRTGDLPDGKVRQAIEVLTDEHFRHYELVTVEDEVNRQAQHFVVGMMTGQKEMLAQRDLSNDVKKDDSQSYLQMRSFVSANLSECCIEIDALNRTGILPKGKVTEAGALLTDAHFQDIRLSLVKGEIRVQARRWLDGLLNKMKSDRLLPPSVKKDDGQFDDLGVH